MLVIFFQQVTWVTWGVSSSDEWYHLCVWWEVDHLAWDGWRWGGTGHPETPRAEEEGLEGANRRRGCKWEHVYMYIYIYHPCKKKLGEKLFVFCLIFALSSILGVFTVGDWQHWVVEIAMEKNHVNSRLVHPSRWKLLCWELARQTSSLKDGSRRRGRKNIG